MRYKCSDSVGQSPDRLWPVGKSWGAMLPAEQSWEGYMQLAQVLCYKLYNRAECFRAGWQGKHFATVKIADFSKLNHISIAVYSVQRAVCVLDSVQLYSVGRVLDSENSRAL